MSEVEVARHDETHTRAYVLALACIAGGPRIASRRFAGHRSQIGRSKGVTVVIEINILRLFPWIRVETSHFAYGVHPALLCGFTSTRRLHEGLKSDTVVDCDFDQQFGPG